MRNTALAPFNHDWFANQIRSSMIGLDDMLRDFLDEPTKTLNTGGYPPYNIERIDDKNYRISLAVAGFREDDLNIQLQNGLLTISGETKTEDDGKDYLHKGIAQRSFQRQFRLNDNVEVHDAYMDNGMLVIDLYKNVPEEDQAKSIPIKNKNESRSIGSTATEKDNS